MRRALGALSVLGLAGAAGLVSSAETADAATITAEWATGYNAPISINSYGLDGAGVFTLNDAGTESLAWCVEAQNAHSTTSEAYSPQANEFVSNRLDFLTFWFLTPEGGGNQLTPERATAGQFLTWYYVDAVRSGVVAGAPVWGNGANGFAPISPVAPDPWNALPQFSNSYPVGIRDRTTLENLDVIESVLFNMYNGAEANYGPWSLSPITFNQAAGTASATIRAGTGNPITVVQNSRWIVRDDNGVEVQNVVAQTVNGVTSVSGISLPAGGSIEVRSFGPGTHVEYDGSGIQRLAVAGEPALLSAALDVAPSDNFVRIIKTSTDPTISVAGTVLALIDGSGDEIDRVTVGANGIGNFAAFDPGVNEGPYSIREIQAAPGLQALPGDVPLPLTSYPISTDVNNPTELSIENRPFNARLGGRKVVSGAEGAPADLSGFVVSIVRLADNQSFGTSTSLTDGSFPDVAVPVGTYRVTETGVPAWWPAGSPLGR